MTDPLIGRTLGHYRLTERRGQGGMGMVYRARDERLDCDVAIKLLPPDVVPDARARTLLMREARNAASLNHPNICTIHTVAESEGQVFIAMEYVEGTSLAERIGSEGMPVESVLRYGIQIADALAHAHERGIVHRDLKSLNVMLTPEGRVKVLDFGVARNVAPEDSTRTVALGVTITAPGEAAGTLTYMAPEILMGQTADRRSDLWSLGVLLFEMASGQLPFTGQTAFELTARIINDQPAALPERVPAGLRAVILRCLAKEPASRFARAGEVRAALEALLSSPSVIPALPAPPTTRSGWSVARWWAAALGVGAVAATAWLIWPPRPRPVGPTLTQLTSANGAVGAARFAPDGQTVVYSADWDGKPYAIYSARPGSTEPVPLGKEESWLLAISPKGEMAILRRGFTLCPGPYAIGPLALTSLAGDTPRARLDGVEWADWSPDGRELAVACDNTRGKFVLEYPTGDSLYASPWITHPRVSRRGDRVAFIDHPGEGDYSGSVVVVDTTGRRQTLVTGWRNLWGLAWSPNGREIWFTGTKSGAVREIHAVTLSGKTVRRVHGESSDLVLMDVHPDGRALVVRQTVRTQILGLLPGAKETRKVPGLDYPLSVGLSSDGSLLLVQEVGAAGGGQEGSMYLIRANSLEKIRLGAGEPLALSPDGRWVLAKEPGPEPAGLALVPTSAGEPRPLPRDSITRQVASWLPDGERFVFIGSEKGHGARTFVQSIRGGPARPITPEGVAGTVLSPDGLWVAIPFSDTLYSTEGGPPRVVPGLAGAGVPLAWATDGRSLFVEEREPALHTIYRFDLESGDSEFWTEIVPPDRAGVVTMYNTLLTPDGKHYAFTFERVPGDLFLFEGLR